MSRYVTEIQVKGLFFLTSSQCIIRIHRYLISSPAVIWFSAFLTQPCHIPTIILWLARSWGISSTNDGFLAGRRQWLPSACTRRRCLGWLGCWQVIVYRVQRGSYRYPASTRGLGDVPMDLVSAAAGVDLGCWLHGSSWSLSSLVLSDIWSCALWGVEYPNRTVSNWFCIGLVRSMLLAGFPFSCGGSCGIPGGSPRLPCCMADWSHVWHGFGQAAST